MRPVIDSGTAAGVNMYGFFCYIKGSHTHTLTLT